MITIGTCGIVDDCCKSAGPSDRSPAVPLERLNKIAQTHELDTKRLRAAWALAAIGKLSVSTRDKMLADSSPYVRGWAIQLSLDATADQPWPRT